MNLFKKIYCRAIQMGLRAALPILPYRDPVRLQNVGQLPATLRREGIDTVLLITDKGIRSCGLTTSLEKVLAENNIRCVIYDKTVVNPTSDNVEEARALYLQEGCQGIIGFGGGSAMDCAKCTGARIARPHKSLKQMGGVLRVLHRLPTMISIPTTAGTGSEVTLAAVVTDSKTHHKYAITDFCLIPRYAVHDPELTRHLPASLTASTALDALTHAVEAYIGRSTTKETRANATEAVHIIFENLDKAYLNGDDMTARRNLLTAAYLAGSAFSKSYVGYVHAIAHSLGGKYNLPHGYTNAVLLPWVLEAYGPTIHKKLKRLAIAAGVATESDSPAEAAAAFIQAIRDMNARFGIGEYFTEIRAQDIPELSRTADREANPLYPVPVLMDHFALAKIYETVMDHHTQVTHLNSTMEKSA